MLYDVFWVGRFLSDGTGSRQHKSHWGITPILKTRQKTRHSTLAFSPSIPYLVGFWLSQLFGSQHECHAPRSLRLYYGCIFHGQELVIMVKQG
jgi:hypothetical protein